MTRTPLARRMAPPVISRAGWLAISVVFLLTALVLSVVVGPRGLAAQDYWTAVFAYDGSAEHVIVWELRLPRTLTALAVGPALGIGGALIQAFTRNPLADPGILGVGAGAGLAITVGVVVFGALSPLQYIWFALAGAALVTGAVFTLATSTGVGATPIRLVLAGVAVAAVLGGVAQALALKNPRAFDSMRFWGAGSVAGRELETLVQLFPFLAVGVVLAAAVGRPLNALALGDDVGRALGARPGRTAVVLIVAVTLLVGAATALAGPIGFIGLMVPHIARWLVGADQRWILAVSGVLGGVVLLVADIVGRVLLPHGELRVGLVTAFVGAPVLIVLSQRARASESS